MNIKEARALAKLTQKQVSEILNIPLRTIENWEAGVRNPPSYVEALVVEKIQKIAREQK
jgi:DNA-binding transcriptional regulator YiaG